MNRHIREMQKARSFIRRKRGKTEFELCVIGNYDGFYEQAKEAADEMMRLWGRNRAAAGQHITEEDGQLMAAELSAESVSAFLSAMGT